MMAVIMARPLDHNASRSPSHISSAPMLLSSTLRGPDADGTGSRSEVESPSRKRTSSYDANTVNIEQLAHRNSNSTSYNSRLPGLATEISREHVCLCQPDPKIPRPRNAFILYRQHYQTQVISQHPGLSNPEISKIIGEQWRDQPEEVKNDWKRLADEEKQRHQRQYPDYRYQPRRAGRSNTPRTSAAGVESNRCPKCKGQYITTPPTPLTPLNTFMGRTAQERSLSSLSARPHNINNTLPSRPRLQAEDDNMHETASRRSYGSNSSQPGSARSGEPSQRASPTSPDIKRRRVEDARGYQQSGSYRAESRSDSVPWPGTPYMRETRGVPALPRPSPSRGQDGRMMDPPRRPSPNSGPRSSRSSQFDESLRLPPLKTQLPTTQAEIDSVVQGAFMTKTGRDSQARSVEAMVMTIPFLNKIKVLSKIAPPLPSPGPSSPTFDCRGLVIAVEGAYQPLITEVGKFLEDHLSKDPECYVKTWKSPSALLESLGTSFQITDRKRERHDESPGKSSDIGQQSRSPSPNTPRHNTVARDPFPPYLAEIASWHQRSSEMVNFITTSASTSDSENGCDTVQGSGSSKSSPRIPIALCSNGYSLTLSDRFASSVPINDAYAPVDHWQWMATLWRGIIGPDLTIYVKPIPTNTSASLSSAVQSADPKSALPQANPSGPQDEISLCGAVEISKDCSAIVVRVPLPIDADELNTATGEMPLPKIGIEDRTLRRLGFEVLELIRNAGTEGMQQASGAFWRV